MVYSELVFNSSKPPAAGCLLTERDRLRTAAVINNSPAPLLCSPRSSAPLLRPRPRDIPQRSSSPGWLRACVRAATLCFPTFSTLFTRFQLLGVTHTPRSRLRRW
ncbi:hypothetical protein AMECASPLE_021506 [Ameca splendens]|uniref:Uncharacterized protein n=1 Tax=Ameca splendens TaxID=208324 RepID=A0ABV0ZDE1_9TELE